MYRFPQPSNITPEKIRLANEVQRELTLPSRLEDNNPEKGLAKDLGSFLVNNNFIKGVSTWENSWGCKYHADTGIISKNDRPMPQDAYNYYIVRLGKETETGELLFPAPQEVDAYRFVHETSHAYQNFLRHSESPENPEAWYDKALDRGSNGLQTVFAWIFQYCFSRREKSHAEGRTGFGLSTYGNYPRADLPDERSRLATAAYEDANELITMYLWHPQYLVTFLEYLSGNLHQYNRQHLEQDRLLELASDDREYLYALVSQYISEMKDTIASHQE